MFLVHFDFLPNSEDACSFDVIDPAEIINGRSVSDGNGTQCVSGSNGVILRDSGCYSCC